MSVFVPFNFQPASVSVKTSSYTIPTGSYAYVQAQVDDGGTFTIDAATALSSEGETTSAIAAVDAESASTDATLYTVPSGYIFEGQVVGSGGADLDIGGATAVKNIPTTTTPVKAGSGQVIAINGTPSGLVSLTGYAIRKFEPETNASGSFWLPTGTVINGTGNWRATVSLFDEIS